MPSTNSRRIPALAAALILAGWLGGEAPAQSPKAKGPDPAHWIWYPTAAPQAETRYFRKSFRVDGEPAKLALDATADNAFTLFLDGKKVAQGTDWRAFVHVEATLAPGPHVLAAEATNEEAGAAGFLVRGGLKPPGQAATVHTDGSWKVTDRALLGDSWTKVGFDDAAWVKPADLGAWGVGPWGKGAGEDAGEVASKFKVAEGFKVTRVAAPHVSGSAVSFTFDPSGRPCVGIENGPIARLIDADGDGVFDDRVLIAPAMKNCQGIAFLKGALYAVGDGPKQAGLYRLTDPDGDGVFDRAELVRGSVGGMGEHGPHAVKLGPDGAIYFNSGNHAHLQPPIGPASPYNITYEGELLPHYNDARGHAAGIMAPGGEILRSADDGKTWERVAAGFRNEYDFAFNREGELFSFDSDMEWDVGLPWYRPIRVNHCPPGAEFGWRNGSGKWPAYYYDSLPATLDIGRGSPTGVTFYHGDTFPEAYDDNFLICDWSLGRILAVELTRDGGSYQGKAKELVTGQPLNCTDIEVGPDGAVYFTTGGRGTTGGLFKVEPLKNRAPRPLASSEALSVDDAFAQTSPLSAYGQDRLAAIKRRHEDEWAKTLVEKARDPKTPPAARHRALDLLAIQGPAPSLELLTTLANDADATIRAQAIGQLGTRQDDRAREALAVALTDADPFVRRRACEGLVRSGGEIPSAKVLPLLDDADRWVRFAARIALEHAGPATQLDDSLGPKSLRARLEARLALVRGRKLDQAETDLILAREVAIFDEAKGDDRLDLLRLIGLTCHLSSFKVADVAEILDLGKKLLAAYPSDDWRINRETARLMAYLDTPGAVQAILKDQAASAARDDKSPLERANQIHDAYCLRAMKRGWTADDKRQLWAWYEKASHWDGGFSFLGYLDFMAQELVNLMTPEERADALAHAESAPFPTRVLVRSLDLDAQPGGVALLAAMYPKLDKADNPPAVAELRTLIVEKLGKGSSAEAKAALRELIRVDPERRDAIARALADRPTAGDLPILASALESRDANTLRAVLGALAKVDEAPKGPEAMRNLIRLARRNGPAMQPTLNTLARKWNPDDPFHDDRFDREVEHWEAVYARTFPKGPPIALEGSPGKVAYTTSQLVNDVLLSGLKKGGNPERGKAVLIKAQCLNCHKFGDQGQGLGPELTTLSSRFRPYDILENVVEPSKVVSDQYKSTTIATTDGKVLTGMPAGGDEKNLILLISDGTKVTIAKADVEEQKASALSVMPEGLLDALTLREIADLLALFEAAPRTDVPDGPPPLK